VPSKVCRSFKNSKYENPDISTGKKKIAQTEMLVVEKRGKVRGEEHAW